MKHYIEKCGKIKEWFNILGERERSTSGKEYGMKTWMKERESS